MAWREPRCAPQVRDPSPCLQRGSASVQRGKRPFLLANLLHGVVGYRFERKSHRKNLPQDVTHEQLIEQQWSTIARCSLWLTPPRRTTKHSEPCAEQTVAYLQPV